NSLFSRHTGITVRNVKVPDSFGGVLLYSFCRLICRSVIHHDHLKRDILLCLMMDTVQTPYNICLSVIYRNNETVFYFFRQFLLPPSSLLFSYNTGNIHISAYNTIPVTHATISTAHPSPRIKIPLTLIYLRNPAPVHNSIYLPD